MIQVIYINQWHNQILNRTILSSWILNVFQGPYFKDTVYVHGRNWLFHICYLGENASPPITGSQISSLFLMCLTVEQNTRPIKSAVFDWSVEIYLCTKMRILNRLHSSLFTFLADVKEFSYTIFIFDYSFLAKGIFHSRPLSFPQSSRKIGNQWRL